MTAREDALQDIIGIARRHNLSLADITAALRAPDAAKTAETHGILSRVFGYIGGILVFAGIAIFIGMQWPHMGSAGRVISTLGTGFTLFLAALAALKRPSLERAATPLFLVAALFQCFGLFVMLEEYSSGGNPLHGILFVTGLMLAQQASALYATQRTVLAFTSICFMAGFFGAAFELAEVPEKMNILVTGFYLLCLAHALAKSRHAAIADIWMLFGAGGLLYGSYALLENTAAEPLFAGISAFLVYLSVVLRSRTLLFVSTAALLCYIGEYTGEYFKDTLGWPVTLIILGVLMLGLGSVAVRLHNKYIRNGAED